MSKNDYIFVIYFVKFRINIIPVFFNSVQTQRTQGVSPVYNATKRDVNKTLEISSSVKCFTVMVVL